MTAAAACSWSNSRVGSRSSGTARVGETPFLDIRQRIESGGERGLLGLAFAPDFPTDPRLFVDYTDLNGDTVVSSFTVPAATPDQADPASERILLHIDQPFPNHNGGDVAFGPDGDLYVAMGDGGSGGDPMGNGQSLDDASSASSCGSIPVPPMARARRTRSRRTRRSPTDPNARPEIRASGLRNPWRFSFDRATGDLWIGDVGQGLWEEVDVIRATESPSVAPNFGWNIMEGAHCYEPTTCDRTGLVLPVAEYDHSQGCAIVGGFVGPRPGRAASSTAATSSATRARATSGRSTPAKDGAADRPARARRRAGRSRPSARTRPAACTSPISRSGDLFRIVAAP